MRVRQWKKLFKMTTPQLKHHIMTTLRENGYSKVIESDNFIYAIGRLPVLLVAHLDTVWDDEGIGEVFYDWQHKVFFGSDGLGADDRAGVAAIIDIIRTREGYEPSLLFTLGEERGGTGAVEFVNSGIKPGVNFIIELDRQGRDECVFYDCYNPEFVKYIESFGFTSDIGTFTDISILGPYLRKAAVNLSIGYVYEHTYGEHFYVKHYDEVVKKVKKILVDVYKSDYIDLASKSFKYIPFENITCDCCNTRIYPYVKYSPQLTKEITHYKICSNCYEKYKAGL